MKTSSRQWLGMVIGGDTLLKIKGWVPMYQNPLLMQSLKTTTLHGFMITKTKTQDAPYKLNATCLAEQENEDSNDDKWILCSELDEIEIALPKDDGGD
jgi:hypothetical protein